jgi:hypothetical protein
MWAGIDAGKAVHHCVAMNADDQRVLSRRVVDDEGALLDLIRAVKALADGGVVRGAIDLKIMSRVAFDHAVARRPPGAPQHS